MSAHAPIATGLEMPEELDPHTIVGVLAEAAVVVGVDGRIVAANAISERLFGTTLVGRTVEDLVPEPHAADHARARESFDRSAATRTMADRTGLVARRADGTVFPVDVSLSRIWTSRGAAVLAIIVDTTVRDARIAVLRRQALSDPLTRLANRVALDAALAERFSTPADVRPIVALAIDLDGLGDANRRYGHAGGDAILRTFAGRLRRAVRTGDLVARVGGDEFIVLFDGTIDGARSMARRLTGPHVERRVASPANGVTTTASIGIAVRRPRERADALLRRADEALLEAKAAGRCRVVEAP